ncbi:MAG: lysophospholipid acyltransferase family protein [Verrucomicrobiota bacterium]|nr:lysophospholipid acyltransferase family protein [Verrucomicrobiota bacterium]
MKLPGWTSRGLQVLAFRLIEALARTLRYEFDDRAGVVEKPAAHPFIIAIWHNRLLLLPYVVRRFISARKPTAIISASRDGALLADMVQRFGFNSVRGSRSRRGASALMQLMEILGGGGDLAITPDGPRGPVYEINPGIVFLAQKSGAPVLAVNMEFSSAWRLKSWDRFFIPKPFSRVRVTFAEPQLIAATADKNEFERERLRLQEAMMQLVETR